MAEVKTNVMRILDKEQISYNSYTYDTSDGEIDGLSVAKKMGQDPAQVFKTLVTQGAGIGRKDYYVFVLPVNEELDLKRASKSVGEKAVEMIHVKDINQVTGYIRGGCSPIGMKKAYKTVIDETAQLFDTIIVSAGKIGCQVELSPDALCTLIGASYAALALEE